MKFRKRDLVDAIRHRRHELRRIAVEVTCGEVCVALDLASGEHAVSYLRDVGVELEELGEVDAEIHLRHALLDLGDYFAPDGRERGVVLVVIGLVAELEAGDDVLVVVGDDIVDKLDDFLLRPLVSPCLEREEHLEAVRLPERECGVRVGPLVTAEFLLPSLVVDIPLRAVFLRRKAAGKPVGGVPHALEPRTRLAHGARGLRRARLEPVGVGDLVRSVDGEEAAGVADLRSAGRSANILYRICGEIDIDREICQSHACRAAKSRCETDTNMFFHNPFNLSAL